MTKRIGIIGYGLRVGGLFGNLEERNADWRLAAIADLRKEELIASMGDAANGIQWFEDADDMLDRADLDGVVIGTRCNLHTEMALKVLKRNLPLFLEKPVATTYEDLLRLKAGYEASASQVVVSFPLRNTPLVKLAKEIVDSGKIGTVEHVQAVNNVPYGGVYYHSWYRDESITGGLFLQKATHDFDYVNYLVGMQPTAVCAMKSKQIFKGDKPAGLMCRDCEEKHSCEESTLKPENKPWGEYCCFAVDTGNEDSGSALIRYETGMHVSYSQNFFARRGAQKRGARLLGYKGTLEFDWYTGELRIDMHHEARVETHRFDLNAMDGHGGGDGKLLQNFAQIVDGTGRSDTSLNDGLLSALLCLKANESANTNTFQQVAWT
ncbi:Gfo/Idh/MocA family protein [Paenibacillus sacheonensis]|uniref:Gfo/Idh/MocA family oxidoreductase n=1 Tax=Paenibacillus sacheonensis TaxID=742054 RepID=A0A7X4YJ79_9BACL|nr:Gfo/Idh/MocA family oxidoreductase [Paenibacillus sacheonensis]MBM7564286.1 putative dehydrogenase [Paenibacillus sacheonensis]NBC67391.1 Gfo/Idh/MocA family oxidoreductase [Paenibacillus sacheonensis]